MPRYSGSSSHLSINGQTFTFPPRAIDDFPDAEPFLTWLLNRGRVSPPTAQLYVQHAARLRRTGRLVDLSLLRHRIERTAANAYVKWRVSSYDQRVQPVLSTLGSRLPKREAVRWLRVHALVPPFTGKMTAVRMPAPVDHQTLQLVRSGVEAPAPQLRVVYQPCESWTLHVSETPTAPHTDPCETCITIELDAAMLETIAVAFESAWGHRDIKKVPPEAHMFGEPPAVISEVRDVKGVDKIVAITAADNVTSDELTRMGAAVTQDVPSFVARLQEGADGVYLSRAMVTEPKAMEEVVSAIIDTWGS